MGSKPRARPGALCECGHTKAQHNRTISATLTAVGLMRNHGCCSHASREVVTEGVIHTEFCICHKFKLTRFRPFTQGEKDRLEALVLRCFTGRGSDEDTALAERLMKVNPFEYGSISRRVRRDEVKRLRTW